MGAGLCRAVTCKKALRVGRDFRLLGDIATSVSCGYGCAASSWFVIRFVVRGHRYRVVVVQRERGLPPSTP
jgi:hypothetical protein